MDKTEVILSTYNATKYLKVQLDSILQQDYENISLLIRDDGSTDGTLEILEEYAQKYDNVRYYAGENLGAAGSFFDLMKNVSEDAKYIALSDQDDYWMPEKISVAVRNIRSCENSHKNVGVLYCTNQLLVDENLTPIDTTFSRAGLRPSFGNALVENICTGCTAVFNRKVLKAVVTHIPDYCIMHDFWLYLVASYIGKVIYDDTSYILYRQHADNVLGERSSRIEELKHRIQCFKSRYNTLTMQNKEFVRLFEMKGKKGELAKLVADYKEGTNRFKVATSSKVFRQRTADDIIFRILFLFGLR